MNVSSIAIISILCLAAACTSAEAQKKYDMKSGIITFEQVTGSGKTQLKSTYVVTFDNYGMLERKDKYEGTTLDEAYFSNGDSLYIVKPSQKTAYNRGSAVRGTELRFDWDEVSPSDKKEGKAKKVAGMTILGKKCDAFQTVTGKVTSVFAGWDHICLYSDVSFMGMRTVSKAVKFVENAKIPAGTFSVPSGYAVQR